MKRISVVAISVLVVLSFAGVFFMLRDRRPTQPLQLSQTSTEEHSSSLVKETFAPKSRIMRPANAVVMKAVPVSLDPETEQTHEKQLGQESSPEREKHPSLAAMDMGIVVTGEDKAQLLENEKMASCFRENFQWFATAKDELVNFIAQVETAELTIENNNGIWQAIAESNNTTACASYYSQAGPVDTFKKRVYSDSARTNIVLDSSYVFRFDKIGRIKSFDRLEPDIGFDFFTNGHLKCFGAKTKEGYQYLAYWDEDGKLVKEGVSRGVIGEIKNGKYIKHPNHPDFDNK